MGHMKLFLHNAPADLIAEVQSLLDDESISITPGAFDFTDTPEERWEHLRLASEGARLWGNYPKTHPVRNSPLFAGEYPEDRVAETIVADLAYTKQRLDYYNSLGVHYIGRVDVDPRNLLVVSNKKQAERHTVVLWDEIKDFLTAAPLDWWGSLGIVSAGNPDKLGSFLDAHYNIIPMAYSTGPLSMIKFSGRIPTHIGEPRPTYDYGATVRDQSNKVRDQNYSA